MNKSISSLLSAVMRLIYSIYAWIVFSVCTFTATLCTFIIPGLDNRRRSVTACARAIFLLAGIQVSMDGLHKIPSSGCVVVANHASYLDGILLKAYLPARFSYVIKNEMQRVPIAAFFLKRIGSRFVERFDPSRSARDMRQLLKAAQTGESLAFFPEGTFTLEPGLRRFRAGAFAAAIRARVPVVPVVISGSRYILPENTLLPYHGNMRIDILDPIGPSEHSYTNARDLANLARSRILDVLDEPDLLVKSSI